MVNSVISYMRSALSDFFWEGREHRSQTEKDLYIEYLRICSVCMLDMQND